MMRPVVLASLVIGAFAAPASAQVLIPRNGRDTGYTHDDSTFSAHVARDGSVTFEDKLTLDLTDFVMRRRHEDPYRYEKAKFLASTFDERVQMRLVYRDEEMEAALGQLPSHLHSVWYKPTSLAERKRALFELWDECDEDDEGVKPGAGKARAIILDFVRDHLPANGRFGFSAEELASLNADRASRARFDPYRELLRTAAATMPPPGQRQRKQQ